MRSLRGLDCCKELRGPVCVAALTYPNTPSHLWPKRTAWIASDWKLWVCCRQQFGKIAACELETMISWVTQKGEISGKRVHVRVGSHRTPKVGTLKPVRNLKLSTTELLSESCSRITAGRVVVSPGGNDTLMQGLELMTLVQHPISTYIVPNP